MRERYERSVLTITQFSEEDVITTSYVVDRNNAYRGLEDLNKEGTRMLPDH